jgi:hypothetical protein
MKDGKARYTVKLCIIEGSETYRVWDRKNKAFVLGPCRFIETAESVAASWNKADS